jgi:hypothetical protein
MHVSNGFPLGWSHILPFGTANHAATLQGYTSDCGLNGGNRIGGNAVRSNDTVMSACGKPLQQWVAEGHDNGTTLGPLPHDNEIIAAARILLGI